MSSASSKSQAATFLLSMFFGILGVDRFLTANGRVGFTLPDAGHDVLTALLDRARPFPDWPKSVHLYLLGRP